MIDSSSRPTPLGRSPHLLRLVQHVLFFSMVLVGVVRSSANGLSAPAAALLGILLLGWYVGGQPFSVRRRTLPRLLWLGGLSLLCVAALWASADFAWVSFAVFVTYANALAPVPAIAATAALAIGTGAVLAGRWPSEGHWAAQFLGPMIGAAVAVALVGVSRFAAAETSERQRLLDELVATRDDLALAHLDAGARAERERMTREIHDTLAQGFTSVLLTARRAKHASESGDVGTAEEELDHLETLGREGIEHARRLVRQLPPAELEDRPLPAALDLLGCHGGDAGHPTVEVRIDGEPRRLVPDVEVALLRVAQEAVTNACRHARAERVVVTLTYQPASVSLDIADDGIGFDAERRLPRGFGLSSMRSRVEQVGGHFTVETAPGQGAVINVTVVAGVRDTESSA